MHAEEGSAATLGLTLAFFHRFVDLHGGRDCFQGLKTLDVCLRFVKPYTSTSQLSLVDHVLSQPRGREYAKSAQWLISHSWSYQFLDVLDAIDSFCHEQELSPDTSFWFCMFANNQHNIGDPAAMFAVYLQSFRTALESTGKMVMVLSPWHDPETLKRTWCVYEVYLSIVLNARFEIAMGKTQSAAFLADIQNYRSVQRMHSLINSSNSITTMPSDRDQIFALIEKPVGFVKLDRLVFDVLQGWIMESLDKQVAMAATAQDRIAWLFTKGGTFFEDTKFVEAQAAFQSAVDIFYQTPDLVQSAAYSKGWEAQLYVGFAMAHQNMPREKWDPFCRQAFAQLELRVHRATMTWFLATLNLGEAYCARGDYDGGMPLLLDALALAKEFHGDHDECVTMQYVGVFLSRQNLLAEAEAMLRPALDGFSRLYGLNHIESMTVQANLATCCLRQGRFQEAEQLLDLNVKETLRTLGAHHLQTTSKTMNLGAVQRMLGKYEQAKANLFKCLAIFDLLGNKAWALHCRRNIGLLYLSMGRISQAKAELEEVHTAYLELFAPSHPFCRKVLFDRFIVSHEIGDDFTSMATVELFEQLLAASAITTDTWSYHSCHHCHVPIQGSLVVCVRCPPYSAQFCQGCLDSQADQLVCGHSDGPWTVIPPPTRYLAAIKKSFISVILIS